MSGIFGIVHRTDAPLDPSNIEHMRCSMADWGRDGAGLWRDSRAGLGQARLFSTPECHYDQLPRLDPASGIAFTAAARIDNRAELGRLLNISVAEQAELADSEFLFRAYLRWGLHCPQHVYGDWAFAAWDPAQRKLFLARDHFGNTSLYYYADRQTFAFASSRGALLDLNLAPPEMDELYLAQVLVSWPAYHGDRTIYRSIRRLPPAHTLMVGCGVLADANDPVVRQYWRLEDTSELHLAQRSDYVEAFTEIFDEAVRARLRAPSDGNESGNQIAATLSGGLDSSSVTATAAGMMRSRGSRLSAYTSVPLSDPRVYVGARFGDEFPLAEATARFAGNVDLHTVPGAAANPMDAIRRVLQIVDEPGHAAGNFYWILELERQARENGCRILLTGQMGNAGISWIGDPFSQSIAFRARHLGRRGWITAEMQRMKDYVKRAAPAGLMADWHRRRLGAQQWYRSSAIHPDFCRRLHLLDQRLASEEFRPPATALDYRYQFLMPGRSFGGALHAEMGAAYGLEVRDPTADARVLAFTVSVPDHIFRDPATGIDRWLIREAMKNRVPDEVRLNQRRGRQAGDLVPRLRAAATDVEAALDELAKGPAAGYLDVVYMREVWRTIEQRDTPDAFHKCITVLTRGIMAGLFVNRLAEPSAVRRSSQLLNERTHPPAMVLSSRAQATS